LKRNGRCQERWERCLNLPLKIESSPPSEMLKRRVFVRPDNHLAELLH
jgi:hypothetical protein